MASTEHQTTLMNRVPRESRKPQNAVVIANKPPPSPLCCVDCAVGPEQNTALQHGFYLVLLLHFRHNGRDQITGHIPLLFDGWLFGCHTESKLCDVFVGSVYGCTTSDSIGMYWDEDVWTVSNSFESHGNLMEFMWMEYPTVFFRTFATMKAYI